MNGWIYIQVNALNFIKKYNMKNYIMEFLMHRNISNCCLDWLIIHFLNNLYYDEF